MKECFVILYRGEPVSVEDVEDSGGHFNDRYDYQVRLLRDEEGITTYGPAALRSGDPELKVTWLGYSELRRSGSWNP
jgi:hypothetical protein